MERDMVVPGKDWEFDQEVTSVFEDMLERSIPQYEVMRDAVTSLATTFLPIHGSLLDIGCSKGEALARIARLPATGHNTFVGLEISQPMIEAALERFIDDSRIRIYGHDLREGITHLPRPLAEYSVVLSVLTLMFVPVNYRLGLLRDIYDVLEPGGALILVEKTLGEGATLDDVFTANYHAKKVASGYTPEDVERKRLSLEGVLVPLPPSINVELLQRTGFREIGCFWTWMNFSGWVAVK